MPKLILDLDLTVFAHERDLSDLDPLHTLSSVQSAWMGAEKSECLVRLINPLELSELIQTACEAYDGIIILTSGCWHEDVRNMLAECLELSDEVTEMVRNCLFLSSLTCRNNFPDHDVSAIMNINKNRRFSKYLEQNASLSAQQFVLLDDNPMHINSFAYSSQVMPIHVSTRLARKDFYQHAVEALLEAKVTEKLSHQCLPDSLCSDENAAPLRRQSASIHSLFVRQPQGAFGMVLHDVPGADEMRDGETSDTDEKMIGGIII